jgi:hypothetical protein
MPKDTELAPAAELQEMLDAERREMTYDPRYHGLYDARQINPGDVTSAARHAAAAPWDAGRLISAHAALYDERAKKLAADYAEGRKDCDYLQDVIDGRAETEGNSFAFRGEYYRRKDAPRWLERLEQALERDFLSLCRLDEQVFLVHFHMALQLGKALAEELLDRYVFHVEVQGLSRHLADESRALAEALHILGGAGGPQMDAYDFIDAKDLLRRSHEALQSCHLWAERLPMPALENVTPGEPLSGYLFKKSLMKNLKLTTGRISGKWVGKLLGQFEAARGKLLRVHFKSLGGILAMQERLSKEWLARHTPKAAQPAAAPPRPAAQKPAAGP